MVMTDESSLKIHTQKTFLSHFHLFSQLQFMLFWQFIHAYMYSPTCTSWNFRGGFIFASQTLANISTSIYVYL